jgi:hypothetical protein
MRHVLKISNKGYKRYSKWLKYAVGPTGTMCQKKPETRNLNIAFGEKGKVVFFTAT